MSTNRIILDCDGVLCDFILGYTLLACDEGYLDRPWSTYDNPTWDIPNLTKVEQCLLWDKINHSHSWWETLQPLYSREVMWEIDDLQVKHDVYFVTNRTGVRPKQQTETWLANQGITNPTVIVSARKGDIALGLKATHAIDDKAGNCLYMSYHSPGTAVCVLDRPYNQFDHGTSGRRVKRVKHLTEYLKEVR